MQRRFEGKSFMVTGAGTGFGSALSVRAAEEGAAKVLVHYRSSAAGAERTAERVRAAGAEVLVGDPGREHLPRRRLQEVASYDVGQVGELEVTDVRRTIVWRLP